MFGGGGGGGMHASHACSVLTAFIFGVEHWLYARW